MRLYEGETGRLYTVETVNQEALGEAWAGRLKALGVVKGTEIRLLNKKKSGTAAVKIRGTRLAFGKKLAESIEIRPLKEAELGERRE